VQDRYFLELAAFVIASLIVLKFSIRKMFGVNRESLRGAWLEIRAFLAWSDLRPVLASRTIQKRLLVTISIVVVSRLAAHLPVPGVPGSVFKQFSTGASFHPQLSVAALGLMPYLSACILMQLLSFVVPPLKNLYHVGDSRIGIVNKYVLALALFMAIVQAFGTSLWLERVLLSKPAAALHGGLWFKLSTTVVLVGGTFFLIGCTKLINEFGVGNGVGLLIAAPIVSRGGFTLLRLVRDGVPYPEGVIRLTVSAAFLVVSVLGALALTIKKTPIKVSFGNSAPAEPVIATLPLRPSWAGQVPLFLAQTFLFAPFLFGPAGEPSPAAGALHLFVSNYWIRMIAFGLLTIPITMIYLPALFATHQTMATIRRYDGKILSDHEVGGQQTVLRAKLKQVAVASAFTLVWFTAAGRFFEILPVTSTYVEPANVVFKGSLPLGLPTSFILIAIICDTIERMKVVGFLAMKRTDYKSVFRAFTEVEARIKAQFLQSHSIECITDPVRLSWVLPIKTSLDHYNLYVPKDEIQRCGTLLEEVSGYRS